MDRISAHRNEPKPPPNPAGIEREKTFHRRQHEQQPFPENEGLVKRKIREASDIESPEGAEANKDRAAAAQRGRVD